MDFNGPNNATSYFNVVDEGRSETDFERTNEIINVQSRAGSKEASPNVTGTDMRQNTMKRVRNRNKSSVIRTQMPAEIGEKLRNMADKQDLKNILDIKSNKVDLE